MQNKSTFRLVRETLVAVVLAVGIVMFLAWIISSPIKKWEQIAKDRENRLKENIKTFVITSGLGKPEVIDGFYHFKESHYGANVSIDRTKPMLVIQCRVLDDVCWVVKELR